MSVGNGREVSTLDPHLASSWADLRVIEGLFEALVVIDPVTKEAIQGMAEAWESWDGGKRWRFKIRKGAKWSNGDPITSFDFIRSAQRMLDPHMGSEIVVHFLYPLKNAENYHRGNLARFDEVGIHAVNDRTLLLELEYSSASFLVQLSYFFPVQKGNFPKGRFYDGAFRWGTGKTTVSNGAYRLKAWFTNELIVLGKNPFYWDFEKVRLSEIRFFPISDITAEEHAFRAGQLDVTSKVPIGRVAWYQEHVPQALRVDDRLGLFFLQLNHGVEPLNKVEVRQALAMSINRKELVDLVLKDGKQAASWVLPLDLLNRVSDHGPLAYDVAEAQRLLASVGFPDGVGFPQLTVLINTSEAYQALAQAIQFMWKENLGINVILNP